LGVFWDRVSRTICPGWLQTVILLISVSWVARTTGMSHQRLVSTIFLTTPLEHLKRHLRFSMTSFPFK
jgi:hypothetical protein